MSEQKRFGLEIKFFFIVKAFSSFRNSIKKTYLFKSKLSNLIFVLYLIICHVTMLCALISIFLLKNRTRFSHFDT